MAAPTGNKFWMLRYEHGRKKAFESPEELEKACLKYFEETEKTFYPETDWVGKDATPVEKKHPRPFTIETLCIFLEIDKKTWHDYGNLESHKDFHPVVTRMNDIIAIQQYELGITGFHNPNLVAMKLGMKQKTELDVNDNRTDISELYKALKDQTK
jgi:hypothetical protein